MAKLIPRITQPSAWVVLLSPMLARVQAVSIRSRIHITASQMFHLQSLLFVLLRRLCRLLFFAVGSPPTQIFITPPPLWHRLLGQALSVRQRAYLVVVVLGLLGPVVAKAQLPGISIPTPSAVCAGQSLTLLPALTSIVPGSTINISAATPAGLTVLASTSSGIVIATSPNLSSGVYSVTVNTSITVPITNITTNLPAIVVPITLNGLPVPTLSNLTGSVIGSALTLATCPVGGGSLSYTVLSGTLSGTVGTGAPVFSPALNGQVLSVACTGGTCPGRPTSLTLPTVALPSLNIPTPPIVCVGQGLSLTVLPINTSGVAPSAIGIGITGPAGLTIGALGPDGVLTVSGLQSGTTTLTVSLSVLGTQILQVPVNLQALPLPVVSLSSLTGSTLGSLLNLGSCPLGSTLNYTVLTGSLASTTGTGGLTLIPALVGQSLSVVCSGGPCPGIPTSLTLPTVALPGLNIPTPPIVCVGQPLSLTVLPTNLGALPASAVNIAVTGPAGVTIGALDQNGVLTVSGLQSGTTTLTVSLSVLGTQILQLPVNLQALPLPVLSLSSLVGSTLGSALNLGSCPVGTLLNYTVLTGSLAGTTGTGSLTFVPALNGGQSIAVVCSGGTCPGVPTTIALPTIALPGLNIPTPPLVCVGQPLSLTVLPINLGALPASAVNIAVTGPAGVTIGVLDQNGVLTVSGLQSGTTTLTVSLSVLGTQVAQVPVNLQALPLPVVSLSSLTGSTLGSALNLGSCPIGSTLNYTVLTGSLAGTTGTGSLSLIPALVGQSLSVVCSGGPCLGIPLSLTLPTVALPGLNIPTTPIICVGQPLSLTVLPINLGAIPANAVNIAVTGPAGVTIGALGPDGVLTVSGLQSGTTTLTVSLSVLGTQILQLPVNLQALPLPMVSLSSLTGSTLGSSLNLGSCPIGSTLNYTVLTGSLAGTTGTGNLTLVPALVGQSLSVVCTGGPCPGIPLSLTLPTIALPGLNIPTTPIICVGQPLSLTVLPINLGALPTSAVNIAVTGPAGVTIGALDQNGVLTVSGLQSGTTTLTVSLSVLGAQVAQVPVNLQALPLPVPSLSSLTGSTLGSVLNLGSCPVGTLLSYTVLTGPLAGSTGAGNLTLLSTLVGQQLSVACTGGTCLGIPSTIVLPLPSSQTLNLGNVPLSVCADLPISLTVLPTPGVDLSAVGLAIMASTTSGTLAISALGPNGALSINGGQLTAGNNQPITITVSLAGLPLASNTFTINVVQPTIPNQPSTVTAVTGSVLSLFGLCTTGTLVNLSNLTDLSGIITIPTTATGVQSLTILCSDNGCLSPARVIQVTVLPLLFNVLNNGPVCLGQPLSLTVLPTNFSLLGTNPLVTISVTGPAGLTASALDANGVLTINGLTSGVNNLSIVASIAGSPVATVGVSATAVSAPNPVNASSLTVLAGTPLSLTALCPTGTVSTTGVGGTIVPLLSLPAGTTGTQVLSLLCAAGSGTCISPITSVTVITLPIPAIVLTPSALQVCVGTPVSITVAGLTLPFGLSVVGVPSPSVNVLGNVISLTGLTAGTTTLTVNAGLTVAGIPVIASQTVTITTLTVPSAPTVVTQGGQVSSLTVAQNSPSVLFDASCSTGSLSYTNNSGVTGTSSVITVPTTATGVISYSAVCVNGACVSPITVASVTVVTPAPGNQPPSVIGTGITDPQTGTVGIPFTSNVATAFTDPNSNTLSFTAIGLPAGLTITTAGLITGTPSVSGSFGVIVTADDGQGGTVSDGFTLNILPNGAPVIITPGTQSLTVNVPASFTVVATDPEGGTVTYAATGLPPSLTINPATGVVTGTPSVTGTFPVTVTVTDPQGNTSSIGFNVVVNPVIAVNQPPALVGNGITDPQNGTVGVPFTSNVATAFTDPNGNPLTFTALGLPAGLSISTAGLISGTPTVAGTFAVLVTANDGQGGTISDNFSLIVAPAAVVNRPPTVVGTGITDPQNGTVGVAFTSNVAPFFTDPDGNPLTFTATGLPAGLTISTGGLITGTPSVSGSFGVSVTANDGQGGTVSDGFTLIVAPAAVINQPPTLVGNGITDPQNGTVGVPFTSNVATAFTDPNGNPLTFTAIGLPAGLSISSAGLITGTPSVSGVFGVIVTANDGQGGTVSDGFSLIVAPAAAINQPPTLVGNGITDPQNGTVGIPFTSNVAPAFTDPNGNPLTFTALGLPTGLTINTAGLITGTPSVSGVFGVLVTANDGQGGTVSDNFSLIVAPAPVINQPPTLVGNGITDPQNGTVGVPFTSNVATAFTDPNGNPLTFTALGLPAGLSISTAGLISGTPTVAGTFAVLVTANDGQGGTVSDNFSLIVAPAAVINQPPMVVGAGITDPQSGTVNIPFTSNVAPFFADPDGNPLTFTATGLPAGLTISTGGLITGTPIVVISALVTVSANDGQGGTVSDSFTLNIFPAAVPNRPPTVVGTGITDPQNGTVGIAFTSNVAPFFTDPDGNPLTFSAIGLPAGLSISTTGLISGTPTIAGTFGVIVTANDGQGGTVSDGFSLIVAPAATVNQPPTVVGNGITDPQNGTVGVPFTSNVASAFTDPNGNPLTFTAIGLPLALSISSAGLITGTPSVSGTFAVLVTANDGQGGTVSDGFSLIVAPAPVGNQPPTVVGTGITDPQSGTVGIAFTSNVAPFFTDPNNNPLTFTALGLPTALSISSAGLITGTPSVSGTFAVLVTANDGQGGTVSDGFTLNIFPASVPNQPPTVVGNGITDPQNGTVGVAFTSNVATAFTDPNGNPLTFSAIGLPPALSISAAGVITGTPSVSGTFAVLVTANDGQGGTVSDGFSLIVAPAPLTNLPPTVVGNGITDPQNGTVGVPFTSNVSTAFTDPNGNPLTFTALGLPTGLTISSAGLISGIPSVSGVFGILVTANDGQGGTVSDGFNLIVAPAPVLNRPPTVVGNGITDPQTGTVGVPFTSNVAPFFTDPDGNPLTFTAVGLPPALSISAAGLITGTPSVSGTFAVLVTANDGQGGTVSDGFTLNIVPAAVVYPPLAVTVLSYNCQTGAIVFGRVGGDPNRVVEYMAIGVRGYSTDPNAVVDAAVRSELNNSTITVMARYVALPNGLALRLLNRFRTLTSLGDASSEVSFVFNFRAFCAGTNLPPTYTNGSLTNQVGTVGVPFSYGIPAGAFVDPEGQPLTYTAAGLPPGLSLNGTTISGTPSVSGVYGVTITARDPQGAATTGTFTITINPANRAPIVVGTIPNQTATVGISYSYGIPAGTFVDPEGQPLTYSASGIPRGLGFSGSSFSGIPTQEGRFLITVTAYDPQNNFVNTTFTLTVIPSSQCGSDPATYGQALQLMEPTYNCQTGTIKFNVRGGNGSVIEFGAIGITPFQTNCFETMDTEVAQDVRDDKANVEPFQIMARQNGQTIIYSFDARAYCRPGGAGNPLIRARVGVIEPMNDLRVTVFGNPTIGEEVEVEIAGAEGKSLTLRVADAQGKVVGQQVTQKAGAAQRYLVPLGKTAGVYFLQVSTPNQVQTVKIVRQ